VNASIRVNAPIMVGMGVFVLMSCGLCFISSALVIAQGAVWLSTTESLSSLDSALGKNMASYRSRCGGGPLANLRGLAIAGIVLACIEIVTALIVGLMIGAFYYLTPYTQGFSCAYGPYHQILLVADPNYPIGIWLVYALGASLVGGSFNIAMGVATLHLLFMISTFATSEQKATPNPSYAAASQIQNWAHPV
jgi:hypothetical protein